ncbi:MAG: hypothetical protein SF187_16895 [Deltaproteobacteria bacterium]|nr:hypothetical protein [Deltaproteobacteria bacterium]
MVLAASALGSGSRAQAASAATSGPIAIHPDNPRYFLWRGKPTVLVGSGEHYGSVINPDFDYKRFLATVKQVGLNETRLFLGDYVEWPGAFAIADNPLSPAEGRFLAPWARSKTPGFARGGNKFDLDRWDPAYFARLHAFLDEADRQGVVVEAVMFFVGPGWSHMPMNPKNNINNTTDAGAKGYLTLNNGNLLARQEAYARKLVRELNRHDNVILDLCNEPWFDNQEHPGFASQPTDATKQWIRRVSEWVRDEESRLPKKHLTSVDISNQGTPISQADLVRFFPYVSGFNVHYDGNAASLEMNPFVPRYFGFNETGFNGTGDDNYRVQGWQYLLSGGALYSHLDYSFTVGHEDGSATPRFTAGWYNGGGSAALRKQLRVLLDFMNSVPFAHMHRDDTIVVGGADRWTVLADPGVAYAFWFPGEGEVTPFITLPNGTYRAEWVDILSGAVTAEEVKSTGFLLNLRGQRHGGGVALRIVSVTDKPKH